MVACFLSAATAEAQEVPDQATIEGNFLRVTIGADEGGALEDFVFLGTDADFAAPEGLLVEGFGVGSFYVPNRRLNERLEIASPPGSSQPQLRFTYSCDGPNIRGLRAERLMKPHVDAASMEVTWTIANEGEEAQWVAPWVRNAFAPGGSLSSNDRVFVPTPTGIRSPEEAGYAPATRNWAAATDADSRETAYAVFHADHAYAHLVEPEGPEGTAATVQTVLTPGVLEPGAARTTTYFMGIVRGLEHIDFASEELAAQLDYEAGQLVLRMASPRTLPELRIEARVLGPEGEVWPMEARRFSLDPNRVIRCTYDWEAPGPGVYEFFAQLQRGGEPFALGSQTGSPHGGIDTQFTVGRPTERTMAAWTDAPFALERGPRTLDRTLAHRSSAQIWFEPGTHKVFPEDTVRPRQGTDPVKTIALAGNERESFQIVIRPEGDTGITDIRVETSGLVNEENQARISAEHIDVRQVAYHAVRVPTHFEGPTGDWPDALPAATRFSAPAGQTAPLWVTVHAPTGTPPGPYTGLVEVLAPGLDPVELWIEAEVFAFDLPKRPRHKTDINFWLEGYADACQAMGYRGGTEALRDALRLLSNRYRITLRDVTPFPEESPQYAEDLETFEQALRALEASGATTVHVPPSLLDAPALLEQANRFVSAKGLSGQAFTQLAAEPAPPSWPRLMDRVTAWQEAAPGIPVMVTTFGLQPFLPEGLDIWGVHLPMLDTLNNRAVLERNSAGGESWWYVHHSPPRPYGNFFLDFGALEHRMLFMQAWAAGFDGMHYWSAFRARPGQDVWAEQLDVTPANGNGVLLYPSADGPVPSIRLAAIRDGLDDFDYLALLSERLRQARAAGLSESLIRQGESALNLEAILPNLVQFTRDSSAFEAKRREIGKAIGMLGKALESK